MRIKVNKNLLKKVRSNMQSRRYFNYTCKDFMYCMFCCCKQWSKDKEKPYSLYNRYSLLEKGVDRFNKEFDSEYYAKSLRRLQMLMSSLMDDNERYLSFYQRTNTISLIANEDSGKEEEDEIFKNIIMRNVSYSSIL